MTEDLNLPPLLKVLISSDGTVSNMLEAWFNEAVAVKVEQTELEIPEHDLLLLNAAPGELAIRRQTQLVGKSSNTCYLTAEALILPARMAKETLECIQSHEAGIGKALRQTRSETLREVLDWGVAAEQAWRNYRIVMGGQPVILITEKFPIASYQ